MSLLCCGVRCIAVRWPLREIYDVEEIDKAQVAIKAFEIDYRAKYPKASP